MSCCCLEREWGESGGERNAVAGGRESVGHRSAQKDSVGARRRGVGEGGRNSGIELSPITKPGILPVERLVESPSCPRWSLIHVSAAFLKIARQWSHGGLVLALLWVTAQLPVPVLHAHGRHPAAPHELPLGQHVERCHGGELWADFLDWHMHWFSPQTVRKGLGETPGDAPESSPSPGECPALGTQDLGLSELMAWASSVSDARSGLLSIVSRIVPPTNAPEGKYGAAHSCSWYGSPHIRLCQMQTWLC